MDASLHSSILPQVPFALGTSASSKTTKAGATALKSIPPNVREQLLNLFGPSRFSDEDATQEKFANTTLPRSTRPIGVVWPKARDEVSELMKILTRHAIPWHAISRGKNWGYGDACAPHNGYLIIDLRQMNRILEINEELAYAVIESGVSQGQLTDELVSRGSRLMADVTGAGPDASIAGV